MPAENPVESPEQTIAHMWLTSLERGQYQRSYRIPDRVTWLPCGCTREAGYEGDVNNQWRAIRGEQNVIHKECSRIIAEALETASPALSDAEWSVALFSQYVDDPRTQIVPDRSDPNEPVRTRAPNLLSVLRSIASGAIEEIDATTRERAVHFCEDMRGV